MSLPPCLAPVAVELSRRIAARADQTIAGALDDSVTVALVADTVERAVELVRLVYYRLRKEQVGLEYDLVNPLEHRAAALRVLMDLPVATRRHRAVALSALCSVEEIDVADLADVIAALPFTVRRLFRHEQARRRPA